MNPVIEDIKDKLVAAGIGTFAATTGWGIYLNTEPMEEDSVATTITLYNTGGPKPLTCMNRSKPNILQPTFQVRVRATTDLIAHTKIVDVVNCLRALAAWDVSTVHYFGVFQNGEESFLMKDQHNRFIWVANFTAQRKDG